MTSSDCYHLQQAGGWAEDALDGRCKFPIGIRNTISNAAYPIAGFVTGDSAFIFSMFVLGIGSGAYHGFKTGFTHKLDLAGMYMVFTGLLTHSLLPDHSWAPWIAVIAGGVTGWFSAFKVKMDLNFQMGFFLFFSSLRPFLETHSPLVWWSWATFLVAYITWTLDKRHSKLTGKWGHAIWHVLAAVAFTLLHGAQG